MDGRVVEPPDIKCDARSPKLKDSVEDNDRTRVMSQSCSAADCVEERPVIASLSRVRESDNDGRRRERMGERSR